jgi:hypothetical protein
MKCCVFQYVQQTTLMFLSAHWVSPLHAENWKPKQIDSKPENGFCQIEIELRRMLGTVC